MHFSSYVSVYITSSKLCCINLACVVCLDITSWINNLYIDALSVHLTWSTLYIWHCSYNNHRLCLVLDLNVGLILKHHNSFLCLTMLYMNGWLKRMICPFSQCTVDNFFQHCVVNGMLGVDGNMLCLHQPATVRIKEGNGQWCVGLKWMVLFKIGNDAGVQGWNELRFWIGKGMIWFWSWKWMRFTGTNDYW